MKLRPYRPADFDRIADLFEAASTGAYGFNDEPREEVLQWFTSPSLDPEQDTRLAFDDDRLAGYVDVDTDNGGQTWWSDIRVHPEREPADVVPTLLDWVEERAGSGVLRAWTPSTLVSMRKALEAHGFRRVRASYRMQVELGETTDEPTFPAGIEVRPLQAGEERQAYEAHQEAFEDSWEHVREPYEEWEHYLVKTESFDPTLWFLAWAGEGLAGLSLCRVRDGIGFVGILAVRRPWRRQGLGGALLRHSFGEFAARGYDRVALGVDAESLTGANRLYESAGMRVLRQLDFFEKRLG